MPPGARPRKPSEIQVVESRAAAPRAAAGPTLVLEVVAGPHQGARFEFHSHETFLVGRAPDTNLQLIEDPYFSRHHFLLEFNPPRCLLRDLKSSNGTRVNGRKVAEAFLHHGDVISGGRTSLRVSLTYPQEPVTVGYAEAPATPATVSISPDQAAALGARAIPAVPGYEILRQLGEGGMGVVFLARRLADEKRCALKIVLPESSASEAAMQMFLREISVFSQLVHPRIVRFEEMGMAQGQFFFAMEYVETVNLEETLAGQEAPARLAVLCGLICQALEGLDYAHRRGFIHRDMKPGNLLISGRASKLQARLADFGLAKNFVNGGFSGMTFQGQLRGTLQYMPPEQILDSRTAKPTADIYAIGVTLYHFLSRRLPYGGEGRKDPVAAILEDPPTPLRDVCPWVPMELAEVVHRAMARNPDERFPTAESMRSALAPFAEYPTRAEHRPPSTEGGLHP